jgi:hypothetical protein
MVNLEHTQKTLEKFRDYVISESKKNLDKGGKYGSYNSTGKLKNSFKGDVKVSPNSFQLAFNMSMYGQFHDKGVKGKFSSLKAPNSRFKFGSGTGQKGGLTKSIESWVKRKGFQFRQKEGKGVKGQFLSYKQTAFLISRSIYTTGLRPSLFFTKPFEAGYKKYIDEDLINQFALDVEDLMQYTLKDIK